MIKLFHYIPYVQRIYYVGEFGSPSAAFAAVKEKIALFEASSSLPYEFMPIEKWVSGGKVATYNGSSAIKAGSYFQVFFIDTTLSTWYLNQTGVLCAYNGREIVGFWSAGTLNTLKMWVAMGELQFIQTKLI